MSKYAQAQFSLLGELVKTWRARYFVLRSGPSPVLTYYRAIEVKHRTMQLIKTRLARAVSSELTVSSAF